jgi:hypothetical protein
MWSRGEKIKHYLNNKNLLKCQRFEEDILLGSLLLKKVVGKLSCHYCYYSNQIIIVVPVC